MAYEEQQYKSLWAAAGRKDYSWIQIQDQAQ